MDGGSVMKIVIASGKGGTGKTTVAVNLAHYLSTVKKEKVRLFDCDVEAPNAQFFVQSELTEKIDVKAPRPVWDEQLCSFCGDCASICQFNAIAVTKKEVIVFNELCHSCGACSHLCPEQAFKVENVTVGHIQLSPQHDPFYFAQGTLNVGESLAPLVIQRLKNEIKEEEINILDASPGTACPVVKALDGMDYCLLVTEPTVFGLSDLKLACLLTEQMEIPTGIVINRSHGKDEIIEQFAMQCGVPIVAKIPFEKKYASAYSKGKILLKDFTELNEVFESICSSIQTNKQVPQMVSSIDCPPLSAEIDFLGYDNNSSDPAKEILILSGKGGTGKTTLSAAFGELMDNCVFADTDVDAANLYLLGKPQNFQTEDFYSGQTYSINQEFCIECGMCKKICHFDAIKVEKKKDHKIFRIDELSCEGCGLCSRVCISSAISSKPVCSGKWYLGVTEKAPMSYAKLGVGKENSGKLVSVVKENALQLAKECGAVSLLIDGPPGTGCPVISSLSGVQLVVIVTEPTCSGVGDMIRTIQLCQHFGVCFVIIINKCDLNEEISSQIRLIASQHNSEVIGEIPFDLNVNEALKKGQNLVLYGQGEAYHAVIKTWEKLKKIIE